MDVIFVTRWTEWFPWIMDENLFYILLSARSKSGLWMCCSGSFHPLLSVLVLRARSALKRPTASSKRWRFPLRAAVVRESSGGTVVLLIRVPPQGETSVRWLPHDCSQHSPHCLFISVHRERPGRWRLQPESGEQMDRGRGGALPHSARQTGETIQVHRWVCVCVSWLRSRCEILFFSVKTWTDSSRLLESDEAGEQVWDCWRLLTSDCGCLSPSDVCGDAEDGRRTAHGQLLLLGHQHGRWGPEPGNHRTRFWWFWRLQSSAAALHHSRQQLCHIIGLWPPFTLCLSV